MGTLILLLLSNLLLQYNFFVYFEWDEGGGFIPLDLSRADREHKKRKEVSKELDTTTPSDLSPLDDDSVSIRD